MVRASFCCIYSKDLSQYKDSKGTRKAYWALRPDTAFHLLCDMLQVTNHSEPCTFTLKSPVIQVSAGKSTLKDGYHCKMQKWQREFILRVRNSMSKGMGTGNQGPVWETDLLWSMRFLVLRYRFYYHLGTARPTD